MAAIPSHHTHPLTHSFIHSLRTYGAAEGAQLGSGDPGVNKIKPGPEAARPPSGRAWPLRRKSLDFVRSALGAWRAGPAVTHSHDRAQPSQSSHTRWPTLSPFRWERGEALVGPCPSPPASHLALSLVSAHPPPPPPAMQHLRLPP